MFLCSPLCSGTDCIQLMMTDFSSGKDGKAKKQASLSRSSGSSIGPKQSKTTLSKGVKLVQNGGTAAHAVWTVGAVVCDSLRYIMDENDVDVGKPVDNELVEAILDHGTKTEEFNEAVENFLKFCASSHSVNLPGNTTANLTWMQLRDRTVSELRELADDIDEHHKKANLIGTVAKVATAILSFGVSLAVDTTGRLIALKLETDLTKSTYLKAQEHIDSEWKLTATLKSLLVDINKFATALKLSAQKLDSWEGLEIARTVFVGIGELGQVATGSTSLARGAMLMNPGVRSLAKQMAKIPKAEWVAKGLIAKQIPTLVSKGAGTFKGLIAAAFGLGPFPLICCLRLGSPPLAEIGSVSAGGKALRKAADQLKQEEEKIADLIKELKKSLDKD